jgi:uncharacterized SAM-binding protein YcdF (DUF218 family)
MIFIKKFFSYFISPYLIAVGIFFVGILLNQRKGSRVWGKRLILISFAWFLFFGLSVVSKLLIEPLERRYISYSDGELNRQKQTGSQEEIKLIIVLGGSHVDDPELPITSRLNEASLVRLIEGIRIFRKNIGSKLLLSGGSIYQSVPVANEMAGLAIELGVSKNDIIIENASKDTNDEVMLLKSYVSNKPFILVTSALHMPRAIAMFQRQGMNPIPAPTGHIERGNVTHKLSGFLPLAVNLYKIERFVHEYFGFMWGEIRGQI